MRCDRTHRLRVITIPVTAGARGDLAQRIESMARRRLPRASRDCVFVVPGRGCASRPPACVCAVRSRDRAVPGLFARYASGDVIVARAFTGDVAQTLPLRLCLAVTVEYTARFVPA